MDILNALVAVLNFVVIPAAAYGAQLALGALGVTLIYGILRFSNFAHGDTMAFGTALVILATWGLQSIGISLAPLPTALLALPIGIALCAVFVLGTDRAIYRFYRRKRSDPIILVMASVGIMFIMNGLTRLVIGVDEIRFDDGARFLVSVQQFKAWTGLSEGLSLRVSQAITLVVTALACWALFRFLSRSRSGKAMRAYSDNEDLALLSGIDPERVVRLTWIIATALAVTAGTLYGLDKSFKAFNYFQILLPIFAASIVGGLGNPLGAVAGGFIVAFSEVAVTYPWKKIAAYLGFQPEGMLQLLSTEYKFAVSFVILIVVLLFRPTGLFRGKSA
ncbi:amino acid/amide ABC transporter membrane protein 1, HAAT family [Paracoccus aminovorans]|uniref:Amino acid/amide ABC transporter membrane protein 1, HAAT family n=1 Tax=Paracoccus aminovorans TaxID=34004 RepID=A0A1I2Y2I8_9RHOB|nr:branched-chain amino acid ABC transporter permease [Paracoccus aminovorans]CQR86055.1 branched-chain amino acid transport system permease [Paracoccus aminovorans]SFH19988.1 amino acid/amide ABC transporter membrane protein 1, HAAT family [Paracoccus aminovorans]